MRLKITIGAVLVALGVGLFLFYEFYQKPARESREMMTEGKMIFERGDRESINQAIGIFTRVIARYPKSRLIPEAYFFIGQSYEKIGLNRLAYLKYSYLLKNRPPYLSEDLRKEVLIRMAHLQVLKRQDEEGINQLFGLLQGNFNKEFRSRVYSELGYTYLKLGQSQRANRMFDIALSEHGSNEEALVGKARARKRMGHDSDAYDLYDHFLKYYGEVSQYTGDVRSSYRDQAYRSGLSAFRGGNYSGAITYFRRVIDHFPGDRLSENALYWTGESYFARRHFDTAISYFNRVLRNSYYHKDQDAQIKKGYAYFLSKRFDLAAREFQTYSKNWPGGRHAATARKWKEMSTRELLYRIDERNTPEVDEEIETDVLNEKKVEKSRLGDEEVAGGQDDVIRHDGSAIELENVAEL